MKKILTAILLILSQISWTQTLSPWEWVRTAGGSQSQRATAIVEDNNKDIVVAGSFNSNFISLGSNNILLTNSDSISFSSNMFVAKYKQNGEVIWARKLISNTATSSNKMVCDNGGNIYVSGYLGNSNTINNTVSFDGNTVYTNNSGGKSFLVKYSPQGYSQWVLFINNRFWGYDSITTLRWDEATSSILIGGSCLGDSVTIGNLNINNTGNYLHSSFFAKILPQSGTVVWLKTTKGNSFMNRINDIATDNNGNIYTAASFLGNLLVLPTLNDTLLNATVSAGAVFWDSYLAKYNQNGNLLWYRKGECLSSDEFTTVSCLNNQQIVIGGYNNSVFNIGGNQINANNFLLEYDVNGVLKKTLGFPAHIAELKKMKNGNGFFVGGNFIADTLVLGNTVLNKPQNPTINNNSNMYFAACDSLGAYKSAYAAGGSASSQLLASFIGDSNKIYVCGYFNQPSIKFGNNTYNSNGVNDLFLAKLNPATSLPIPLKYNIGGTVFAGLFPVDHAIAYLYDTNQNIIETCNIDSMGFYHFYQKNSGLYKVSAELLTNSIYFIQNYQSTFFPDKINFADATTIYLNSNKWGRDIYLQKFNDVNENQSDNDMIRLFPNPAKDYINIEFDNMLNKEINLKIININGQIVFEKDFYNSSLISIKTDFLQAGLYFVRLQNSSGITSYSRFFKMN